MSKKKEYILHENMVVPASGDHFNIKSLDDALKALRDASGLSAEKEKRHYDVKGQKALDYHLE